jgi:hypothetical protein
MSNHVSFLSIPVYFSLFSFAVVQSCGQLPERTPNDAAEVQQLAEKKSKQVVVDCLNELGLVPNDRQSFELNIHTPKDVKTGQSSGIAVISFSLTQGTDPKSSLEKIRTIKQGEPVFAVLSPISGVASAAAAASSSGRTTLRWDFSFGAANPSLPAEQKLSCVPRLP